MNNRTRISYALCGAIVPWLCTSVQAEEVATHSLEVGEKVLLMESINVTSNKEIADKDELSGDPDVDQLLNMAESLANVLDESTIKVPNSENEEVAEGDSDNVKDQSTTSEKKKEKLSEAALAPVKKTDADLKENETEE